MLLLCVSLEISTSSNLLWMFVSPTQLRRQCNSPFPSCLSRLFQRVPVPSLLYGNYFIHMRILGHLLVNGTHFHVKAFAPGLALKQVKRAIVLHVFFLYILGEFDCMYSQ